QSLAALQAGKHVACTVPMATTIGECEALVEAQRASGKSYMMMETVVYSREFLFVKQLYDQGVLGRIQFLPGAHLPEIARPRPSGNGPPARVMGRGSRRCTTPRTA